jgi:hypothetical protein
MAINPKITKDDKPPAVTKPRKTLSERLGSVVISRGAGGTRVVNLLTQTFLLPSSTRDVKQKLRDLQNARSNGQEVLGR